MGVGGECGGWGRLSEALCSKSSEGSQVLEKNRVLGDINVVFWDRV